jgi:hypothetical protein
MKQTFVMIGESQFSEIIQSLEELKAKFGDKIDNDYITEKEARTIFQRKSTWFWQMRKEGKLPFSKIGKTIYYSKAEIKNLFELGKKK